ncbi:MAG: Rad52/Rad22 family DNA repair protein [Blastocatellia bacterium]
MTPVSESKEIREAPTYRRPIREIIADLSKPIPDRFLKDKVIKGNKLTYIPWHYAVKLLDWYAPGWCYEVRNVTPISEQTVLTVRLIIPAAEGDVWREATGIEEDEVSGYGDTSSNAESMALRRAAAKFGLGLYLYDKK